VFDTDDITGLASVPRLDDSVKTLMDSLVMIVLEDGNGGEQDRGFLQEPASEFFGLGCDPDPLVIDEQNTFVLFLLFLEDSDLFLEILDGLPEFPVDAVGQTGDECDPQFFDS
jgi:hypothetical protein